MPRPDVDGVRVAGTAEPFSSRRTELVSTRVSRFWMTVLTRGDVVLAEALLAGAIAAPLKKRAGSARKLGRTHEHATPTR